MCPDPRLLEDPGATDFQVHRQQDVSATNVLSFTMRNANMVIGFGM